MPSRQGKATDDKSAPVDTSLLERKVEQLREQLQGVAAERDAARADLAAATAKKKREPKKFAPRNYPLNGFRIAITGKECMEDEILVEALGDVITIYTGDAAEAARGGAVAPRASQPLALSPKAFRPPEAAARTPEEQASWSNVGDNTGLGPSRQNLTPEQKAATMSMPPNEIESYLENIAGNIVATKGNFSAP